ncbi:hypothetical protein [Wohlfahrtiimonas larvae]|uniref:Uncharacterized protein n=1 Tax=Wohlfahrtiimonas larvae TaxID=1157986 RepID=A0ABP9MP60_9GAMM|nr:hypothetical protein [Wohlfahrtiimonas larvae]
MQQRNLPTKQFALFSLFVIFLCSSLSFAIEHTETIPSQESVTDQLITISNDIKELQNKRANLSSEIKKEKDDAHKKELEDSLKRANAQLKEYTELFEKISLGGIDTARFDVPAKQAIQQVDDYNWQKELIQIAQPVFTEMKKITDAPRKRDLLRLEQKEIDERLSQLNKGLSTLNQIQISELPESAQKNLKDIQDTWNNFHKELERERRLTTIKLDELTVKEDFTTRLTKGSWSFIKGRGLLLVITISVISILLYSFNRFLVLLESREKNKISIRWRIFMLLYQIITTLITVIVTLAILYSSGDMVLFGIAILIILAFLVTSRNSIPKYFIKTRIFLNMGSAREGERVIYNDLPWKVSRINLYNAYLVNPLLENGTIRLTIDQLNTMISRPTKMDETWFPTVVNDVVLLPNGSTYKVMRQTPEYVYLTASSTELIYPAKDFIKDKIINITYGYSTSTELAVCYGTVKNNIEFAIQALRDNLTQFIENENPEAFKLMKTLTVDFSRVNENGSAIFMISAAMGSYSTDYRLSLIRTIQRGCMKIAEKHHWDVVTITKYIIEQESAS